ncbi:cytosolic phospholipase A2 gamma-like [Notamacropus eugenii]|uniref:cytosolic phospholipase A2 gamma-like n=1 Tax=Notamacropus eugenii TaxID=9315 RepID=UPI003B685D13
MAIPQQVTCSAKSHSYPYFPRPHISIGFGISDEEMEAVKNRRNHVSKALLNRLADIYVKKVPVVSVLVSGGGLRAAIASLGVLSELSHVGLLDVVTYIAGVSGSTWCMSSLYNKSDGWKDLKKAESEFRRRLQDPRDFSVALKKLIEAAERDDYSLTDFWSYAIVDYLTNELLESHLSRVREESRMGTVPYPIFATIDHDVKFCGTNAWFEFTPDWAGYSTLGSSTLGAYVHTTYCGSECEGGKLINEKPERDFSYLRGLCGSALADMNTNLTTIWDNIWKFISCSDTQEKMPINVPEGVMKAIKEQLFNLISSFVIDGHCSGDSLKNLQHIMTGNKHFSDAATLTEQMMKQLHVASPDQWIQFILEILIIILQLFLDKERKAFLNFFRKTIDCLLKWKWGTTNSILYKYGKAATSFPTDQKYVSLMDSVLATHSAYPLVLPPMRNSDIILSFDFSEGDPFETIKATAKYCKAHHIPFPSVDDHKLDQEAKAPSDFYIFEEWNAPVVMYFPLFNKVNCGSEEGIKGRNEIYKTINLGRYSDKEVCELLDLSKANVRKNKDRILEKIHEVAGLPHGI